MNELTVIANDLIPVYETEKRNYIVNARELHGFLKVARDFPTWFKHRVETFDLQAGQDFSTVVGKSTGGRPRTEYYLHIDTAKEMAMVENNEQGKKVRQYFIAVEKKARDMFQIPQTLPEALRMAAELAEQIEKDKPKVLFADKCLKSNESILIRELAKIACENGFEIGEKGLFKRLREWGLLMSNNEPYQRFMKYFEVVERPYPTYSGAKLSRTTKVLPIGQAYILNRLEKERRAS